MDSRMDRRTLLRKATGAAVGLTGLSLLGAERADARELGPLLKEKRIDATVKLRRDMADHSAKMPLVDHVDNGDEERFGNRIGSFHKALPHDSHGEVDRSAYNGFLKALRTGDFIAFEGIKMGGRRRLVSPQAGLSFELEGLDSRCFTIDPSPRLDSAERAGEHVELAWMALLRDLNFVDYERSSGVSTACEDVNALSDFKGPRENEKVTPRTLFRSNLPGVNKGPFVSQFLWKPIPYGAITVEQKLRTTVPGRDYLTDFEDFLAVQNGVLTGPDAFDDRARYIRNPRDLGQYVHMDVLFQSFFNAAMILFGYGAPLDLGNPYSISTTQEGFATLGCPYIMGTLAEVASRALRAVWYQKWYVHRTLRPEAYAGLVHLTASGRRQYPIHEEAIASKANAALYDRNGAYLLPQGFPEGSPAHPSYGAGHATVAAACATFLKAAFDEQYTMPHPVVADREGDNLLRYTGPDADTMHIGGELNKLAMNIGVGRNMAGVHWRSDMDASFKLGEEVAIAYLKETKVCLNEPHSYTLSKFDGSVVAI